MRALITDHATRDLPAGAEVTDDDLATLYTAERVLRLNFVTTLDGAATGSDGRSGSINSAADHRGFVAMRRAADVLLVGAATARAEQYRAAETPIVVVSTGAQLPETTRGSDVVLATTETSGAQESDRVWICGPDRVDLALVIERARQAFGPHVLCEGGPTLAAELVAAGLVDELALSWTPELVGGTRAGHPRVLDGDDVDVHLTCRHLLEEDGTLLGLWRLDDAPRR